MPTDEPVAPASPDWRVRLDELLAAWRDTASARWRGTDLRARVALAATGVVVLAATWWLVRPADRPPIEDLLPRAVASGAPTPSPSVAGTAGSTAGDASGSAASGAIGLVVHVVGAVQAPGVVRLATGARVLDAVAAAGGLRADADPQRVNLAAKLVDGQRVLVPVVGQPVPDSVADPAPGGAAIPTPSPDAPLNLNEATAAQLDALPGVGPATAAAIVAHRTQNGPFRTVDALGDVRGIGPAKLEQLRPLVAV